MDLTVLREKLVNESDLDIAVFNAKKVGQVVNKHLQIAGLDNLDDYTDYLDSHPEEVKSLLNDLIPQPDDFFTDKGLTRLLQDQVLPDLLKNKQPGDPIRIWIPGCNSGYLAYETALLLWKLLGSEFSKYHITIIATGTNNESIQKARSQSYPRDQISRLAHAGWPVNSTVRKRVIHRAIRSIIIFGVHNPVFQSPYTRIDLILSIGCLPFFEKTDRTRVKYKFLHSLVGNGQLVLGKGEIIGTGALMPTKKCPYPIFTKPIEVSEKGQAKSITPLESLKYEDEESIVLVINKSGMVLYTSDFSKKVLNADVIIGKLLPVDPFHPILMAIKQAVDESFWNQSETPIKFNNITGTAIYVPLGNNEASPVVVVVAMRDGKAKSAAYHLAVQMAAAVVQLQKYHDQIEECDERYVQAIERGYQYTEELSTFREELQSQNFELTLIIQNLRQAIEEQQKVEADLNKTLLREQNISNSLQKALIPELSESVDGIEVSAKYQAAFEEADVGGDFYHGARIGNSYVILLGDVSGKGLDAAALGSMTRHMALGFITEAISPASIMSRLNEAISTYSIEGRFVTLIYMLLDINSHIAYYANAGHEPIIHISGETGKVEYSNPTGPALGVIPNTTFTTNEIQLAPGDMLVLYTDGLSDAGPINSPLMAEGMTRIILKHIKKDLPAILDAIFKTATDISGGKLRDDAACLLLRIKQ